MRYVLPLVLTALATGCQQPAETAVDHAWVRLSAAPGRPAAGYFALRGGAVDRTLTGVASPAAGRIELHETMTMGPGPSTGSGGTMTMRPIGQVALPAGGTVAFAPGGRHLMLFDVKAGVKPGDRVPLTFRFGDGTTLRAQAVTVAAGDPPPTR